jgi:hypothetical protein
MNRLFISLFSLIAIIFIFSVAVFPGPDYTALCKKNETMVFSFLTKSRKTVSICVADGESYIVYRLGTKNKIELEFPGTKSDSWSKFRYSYYMRGGAAGNDGMDINYLRFEDKGLYFSVYEEYSAVDNKKACGIKTINESSGRETDTAGIPDSIRGSLTTLRNYQNIQVEE